MRYPTIGRTNPHHSNPKTEDPVMVMVFRPIGQDVEIKFVRDSGETYTRTRPRSFARDFWASRIDSEEWTRIG